MAKADIQAWVTGLFFVHFSMLFFITLCIVVLNGMLSAIFIELMLMDHAARTRMEGSWPTYKQAKEVTFGALMPGLLISNILLSAALAIEPEMRWAFGLTTLLMLGVLVVTIGIHLPINTIIRSCDFETPPTNWNELRRQWRRWNWIRCGLAYGAFVTAASSLSLIEWPW